MSPRIVTLVKLASLNSKGAIHKELSFYVLHNSLPNNFVTTSI